LRGSDIAGPGSDIAGPGSDNSGLNLNCPDLDLVKIIGTKIGTKIGTLLKCSDFYLLYKYLKS
jgi:hypothetical protein